MQLGRQPSLALSHEAYTPGHMAASVIHHTKPSAQYYSKSKFYANPTATEKPRVDAACSRALRLCPLHGKPLIMREASLCTVDRSTPEPLLVSVAILHIAAGWSQSHQCPRLLPNPYHGLLQ